MTYLAFTLIFMTVSRTSADTHVTLDTLRVNDAWPACFWIVGGNQRAWTWGRGQIINDY